MIKKFLAIISLLGLFLVSIQSASALQTYVGVKILNLTDDPSASCAGQAGYGSQGRIRAISSILPDYPIYFELRNASDNSLIWSGNSMDDTDYEIGDIIQMPQLVNLQIGQDYKLFFDIDAIRIYLPLINYDSFEATIDDNYWTAGGYYDSPGTINYYEKISRSNYNGCNYEQLQDYVYNMVLVSNNRNSNMIDISCLNDGVKYTCDERGFAVFTTSWSGNDFNMGDKYKNLYTSTVGNFEITFTLN